MAAERRPYAVTDQQTGARYLVRAAANPSQALRAVTRDRFKVTACSASRVIELADRRMTQAKADDETAAMEAVLTTLRGLAAREGATCV